MNILILGHNGYLGSYLSKHLNSDILFYRNIYDNGNKYDYIINCIGRADLEYCEKNGEESEYCNKNIISDIIKCYPLAKIINFSSYYVYDDTPICSENSNVTYKYNYTRHKLESEQLIKNGVTFRIGKLFGNTIKSQNKLTEHILSNDVVKLDNIKFNPTSVSQILDIIKWELEYNKLYGTFNVANDEYCTHYEYGLFIDKILNSKKCIINVENIGKNFHNYGRFLMSCDKIKQYITLRNWKNDVEKYIINYKNNI